MTRPEKEGNKKNTYDTYRLLYCMYYYEYCCDDKKKTMQEGDTSGSTALVILFDGRSRCLLVANVGDSRCVASRAGQAARLSSDHRLGRPDERARVLVSLFCDRHTLQFKGYT